MRTIGLYLQSEGCGVGDILNDDRVLTALVSLGAGSLLAIDNDFLMLGAVGLYLNLGVCVEAKGESRHDELSAKRRVGIEIAKCHRSPLPHSVKRERSVEHIRLCQFLLLDINAIYH